MARPNKAGLDYFPFDVDFFEDDKVQLIESEFGLKGVIIAVKLLCKIYKENGYYYKWGDDECLLFAKNAGAGIVPSMVNEVITGLVRRSFFDKRVYDEFCILTSRGIQKRFFEAAGRRKNVEIIKEIIVVEDINANINSESKVKKKKEDKSSFSKTSVLPQEEKSVLKAAKEHYALLDKNKKSLIDFVSFRPGIIEPYVDLWNIWAEENGKPKVKAITKTRTAHLNARLKEKSFDFIEILSIAKKSQRIAEGTWFTFDWFTSSQGNYMKVLEGNYITQSNGKDNGSTTEADKWVEQIVNANR